MANEKKALLLALAAVMLWSTVATAFKITLEYMSPLQMVTGASIVSFVVLTLICAWQGNLALIPRELQRRPWYYLSLAAISPLTYHLVLFQAYELLPGSEALAINYTWAITLTLLAAIFLGQNIRRKDWVASFIGYLAVLLIATRGDLLGLNFSDPVGVGLAFLSTILWAIYWILNTRHQGDPTVTLLLCFGLASPILLVASFAWGDWQGIPWQGWVAVSYVGVFEMGLTFLLWLNAMKLTRNTALISNLIFISPFISFALLAAVIGESIHPITVLGLLMIILAQLIQRLPAAILREALKRITWSKR